MAKMSPRDLQLKTQNLNRGRKEREAKRKKEIRKSARACERGKNEGETK